MCASNPESLLNLKPSSFGMVDVDKLYKTCLNRGPEQIITARTVYDFVRAPFKVWCDLHAPEEAKEPISEYQKLLMEQGKRHEEQTVASSYPEAEKIIYVTPEEGFRIILELMRDGVAAMHNAPIFYLPEGLTGRADILERADTHSSVFGDYHFIVKEIKLAKNIQDHHRIQTAYYNYTLGRIQGYMPDHYILVNRDQEELYYKYDEREVLEVIHGIQEIFGGKDVSPTYGSCDWPWETYCNEEAIRRRDVSLVGWVGTRFKEKLGATGFRLVSDLATAKISDLIKIRGIGQKRAQTFIINAKALAKGTHIKLANITFPEVSTEIFLDLEGTGEQVGEEGLVAIDYLIGVLVRENGKEKYLPFIAEDLDGEERMFHDFIKWLADQDDYVIYHWHHYEKTHLRRLAERYGIPTIMHDRLFGRLRDLYKDAVSSFAFPTYGNGLKEIAEYMGFSWRHDIDAMDSIVLFFKYVQDPENNRDNLKKVLDYNEDDCKATKTVKDWLERES